MANSVKRINSSTRILFFSLIVGVIGIIAFRYRSESSVAALVAGIMLFPGAFIHTFMAMFMPGHGVHDEAPLWLVFILNTLLLYLCGEIYINFARNKHL